MSAPRVPLNELAAAVQSAVEQTLAKHGAVPIEKLWVGFVAPDKIATPESAQQVANVLAKEAGVKAQASVGQLGGVAVGAAQAQVANSQPPSEAAIADLKAKKPIYVGTLKDNKGKVVIDKTYDNLDPFLDKMDYLLEGVVGSTT